MNDLMPALHLSDVLTTRGLILPAGLRYERWEQLGQTLGQLHTALPFAIGDWCNYGEGRYGEKYAQALDLTGLDYGTLRNYASVAARFVVSRRRDTLSFGHHAEVTALADDDQDHWLTMAEREGWSVRDLRQRLRGDQYAAVAESVGVLRELRATHGDSLTPELVKVAVEREIERRQGPSPSGVSGRKSARAAAIDLIGVDEVEVLEAASLEVVWA